MKLSYLKRCFRNESRRSQQPFSLNLYIAGQYDLHKKGGSDKMVDYNPITPQASVKVQIEDGILLPDYRLPTRQEWEYLKLFSHQ